MAIVVFLVGVVDRYRTRGFTYSSLSSQFLEGRGMRRPVLLFHWGLLAVFLLHLLIFLFPSAVVAWNSSPTRRLIHETLAFTFGICALLGMIGPLIRRFTYPRLQPVTRPMDVVIELLRAAQILLGLGTALGYRWGSTWFATDLSPYLLSIVKGSPRIDVVSDMPTVIKLHVVGAFVILGLVPFTRLVHFLVAPLHYTWRSYQQVIWYWDRSRVRAAQTAWTTHPPKNN